MSSPFPRTRTTAFRPLGLPGTSPSADAARCRELRDRSTATATALSPYLGYETTAAVARESVKTGAPIRDIVLERGLMTQQKLDRVLSADNMTRPGIAGEEKP